MQIIEVCCAFLPCKHGSTEGWKNKNEVAQDEKSCVEF
jgi:hypothetical protein